MGGFRKSCFIAPETENRKINKVQITVGTPALEAADLLKNRLRVKNPQNNKEKLSGQNLVLSDRKLDLKKWRNESDGLLLRQPRDAGVS